MSTFERLRDARTGEIIQVERVRCGTCGFFIDGPNAHPQCLKISREQEAMASMAWKMKQENEIKKMIQDKPKTQQQIEHEKFAAETKRVQDAAQKEYRKQRLSQLEAEVEHLKKLIESDK